MEEKEEAKEEENEEKKEKGEDVLPSEPKAATAEEDFESNLRQRKVYIRHCDCTYTHRAEFSVCNGSRFSKLVVCSS